MPGSGGERALRWALDRDAKTRQAPRSDPLALKNPRRQNSQTPAMIQDPHTLRPHYAKAATRRRRAKALRTLALCLLLALAAGIAFRLFTLAA